MSSPTPAEPSPPTLDRVLVTSRDFDEYLAMFDVVPDRLLTGRVLDCPGGASDFGARLRELGGQAVAVDPIYGASLAGLARLVDDELRRGVQHAHDARELYDFSWAGGFDAYLDRRATAARRFLADYARREGHYVQAALPDTLPFPDGHFTLALVPNLLFAYANLFDLAWHVRALRELTRVAAEVRIHPVTDTSGRPYADLSRLTSLLADVGVHTRSIEVGYRLREGTGSTLICGSDR
ncbi:hypothetical protein [Yinghuangia seranimata]|uniref:hypothetical protein n=1 Tax=Yinghuangia seranimata TaxID=408067 RepID=UPI00248C0CBD|nr:hypothetical protein [Yinghuangia seranimata]MDI2132425.1 hypothetical protein [Yinghuangia seranimata]